MDNVTARRVSEFVEALLLAPVLRPLADGAGVLGEYELDLFAQAVARNDPHFARALAVRLERSP